MNAYDPTEVESTDLDQRDVRALTQYLTVLPEAPDLYTVVSESGESYTVDTRSGACECPDHQYRGVQCKHQRRCAFATGERPIPAWVVRTAIDEQLGAHVDATPRVAATDGGVIEAESTCEDLAETDERPDDCDCAPFMDDLPCWPCYREEFDNPNPNIEE